ncbi:MAG: putative metal-dependent hydrolase [Lewinellaceae bacterium]|nr:putative metal-dependent hydrolase [Lewinellaceae bacterium]
MPDQTPLENLRYPTGRFSYQPGYGPEKRREYLESIRSLPAKLRAGLDSLGEAQLDLPYRPGGWTARQVIHHIADSHMNAYIRFKLALTESRPTIKPYDEKAWAELPDTANTPIQVSLALLEALHQRWVVLLEELDTAGLQRSVFHPESQREIKLEEFLALYAWHGEHHLAHLALAGKKI